MMHSAVRHTLLGASAVRLLTLHKCECNDKQVNKAQVGHQSLCLQLPQTAQASEVQDAGSHCCSEHATAALKHYQELSATVCWLVGNKIMICRATTRLAMRGST